MASWIAASFFLSACLASGDDDGGAPESKGQVERAPQEASGEKKESGEAKPGSTGQGTGAKVPGAPAGGGPSSGGQSTGPSGPSSPARAIPSLKTPQATSRLQEGLKKLESGDYTSSRAAFNAVLKDASTPADKKLLLGYIDDTKVGSELDAARDMVGRKEERKALVRVDKALKTYPDTALRPLAEKFIREVEEQIYLVLDDFEPGEALQRETEGKEESQRAGENPVGMRSRKNQSYNPDPRFVKHGKGSMKWRVGGDFYGYYRFWYDGYGYQSSELKNPITKWRYLVFSVYLPDADDGSLRVTLSPEQEMGVYRSQYTKKFIDFRGKRGWLDVRLDLSRDFGNTANIKLEDIRFIRIEYMHQKYRTVYLDFVHLE